MIIFGYLAEVLKYIMIGCDWLTGGYFFLSLLLFTLAMKILLFPLGIKQQKTQQKAARLRPKEQAIRNRYKGRTDRASQEKMQTELMDMYKKENYNQFGGCLPLLIQMPIILSLFYIIQNPLHFLCGFSTSQVEVILETYNRVTGYADSAVNNYTIKAVSYMSSSEGLQSIINNLPFDGSIPNGGSGSFADFISGTVTKLQETHFPNFSLGLFDMSVTPSSGGIWNWYIFVPIMTFAVYFLTMKLQKKFTYQPASADAANNKNMKLMEYGMPLMSAVFTYMIPSAMAVYWMFQSILGFGQQVLLSKLFPIPKLTEAEIRDMRREEERAAELAKRAAAEEAKNKKSLFHLDDDAVPAGKRKTGTDDGWTEPMGPRPKPAEQKPAGKKVKGIGKAKKKDDDDSSDEDK